MQPKLKLMSIEHLGHSTMFIFSKISFRPGSIVSMNSTRHLLQVETLFDLGADPEQSGVLQKISFGSLRVLRDPFILLNFL